MNAILATLTLVLRTVQTLSAVLRAAACTSGYRLGSDGFTCEGIIIINFADIIIQNTIVNC